MPASALPRRSAAALLVTARSGVAEAAAIRVPEQRYALAHLAALRAASAVLAARAKPAAVRRGPTSAWSLLVQVAPEMGEWATLFAAGAAKRAAAEAGQPHVVSSREADDLLRDVQIFLDLVESTLGPQAALPLPPVS